MVRVFQLGFGKTFVIIHSAISDKLNLGLTRDSFEIRVQNRLLRALGFVVAMTV